MQREAPVGGYHNQLFLYEGRSAGGTIRRTRYGTNSRLGSSDESREVRDVAERWEKRSNAFQR